MSSLSSNVNLNQTPARLFWLHDEALAKPDDYRAGDKLVYLWDANYFAQQAWSLKRRVFIYECLVALKAEIYVGQPAEFWPVFLAQQAQSLGQGSEPIVYVAAALDPVLQAWLATCPSEVKLEVTSNPSHFLLPDLQPTRLKRFSHFWSAQAKALGVPAFGRSNGSSKHKRLRKHQ
ncbi:hypothetical protein [Thiomicrospira sp. ALE5]|uniref:hypothetical protein n=1 Tax=Thiomicrospira sp. ALE5 TaxID=748650 RepID=UPI0008F20A1D|nr:hypothetical protein [Thiomicrospira sp. ALE5]SFR53882.1 hypothetical protein SAMN03092900_0929 [Thiomicrospira sp. ALE5]